MSTLEEIRTRITRIVHDDSYTPDIIDDFINEILKRCAGLVLLPDLEDTGLITVSANTISTPIPTNWNFDQNLYLCTSVKDNRKITVLSSVGIMARKYPDYKLSPTTGVVEACTATRTTFVNYPAPETEEIFNCAFYRKPDKLVKDTDEPSILPDFLQYKLLVSGVCAEIFTEKEEGIDGVMINTNKYNKRFDTAIEDLKSYFKTGQSRPEPTREKDFI